MNLEEQCNPATNPHLAKLLDAVDFEYSRLVSLPLMHENGSDRVGVSLARRFDARDVVWILYAGKGTGIQEHPKSKRTRMSYLGPVLPDIKAGDIPMPYKYQEGDSPAMDSTRHIRTYCAMGDGIEMVRAGVGGLFFGCHNPLNSPIAVRIQREF